MSSSFGSCVSATTAQRSSSSQRAHRVVGHRPHDADPGDVPGLRVFVARIADGHLVVEADGDLRKVLRELRRPDHEQPVPRSVDRRQRRAVEREAVGRVRRMQRGIAGHEVEAARDQVPRLDLAQQRPHPRFARQRLQHELDRAAARQAEPARLVRRHAVRNRLGARLRHAEPARAVHDVVLDAATGHRPRDEPVVADRQHRPFGPRRAAPGLHHGDQQHAAAPLEPFGAALQYFVVDTVHDRVLLALAAYGRPFYARRPPPARRLTPRGACRLLGASRPRADFVRAELLPCSAARRHDRGLRASRRRRARPARGTTTTR